MKLSSARPDEENVDDLVIKAKFLLLGNVIFLQINKPVPQHLKNSNSTEQTYR
jgi:hypothetical protein